MINNDFTTEPGSGGGPWPLNLVFNFSFSFFIFHFLISVLMEITFTNNFHCFKNVFYLSLTLMSIESEIFQFGLNLDPD